MKKLSILLLLYSYCFVCFAQTGGCKIELNISGKYYDDIELEIRLDNNEKYFVKGISEDKKKWIFTYPDSVYSKHRYMYLNVPNNKKSVVSLITFLIPVCESDSLPISIVSFSDLTSKINATFLKTEINEKVPFFRFRDLHNDIFIVSKDDDPDLYVMAKAMHDGYSMFGRSTETLTLTYDERLNNYVDLTKKYPDSHYLISTLASTLTYYKTKNDIEKVFYCFSKENRQSYFGKKVYRYIHENYFENSLLPTWDTRNLEPVIKDTTKHTLVVFSASWCSPCHKQIPLLKEMYNDLNTKLDIVYVSIDEPETVGEWPKLMRKENIPWRSLLATDNLDEIREKYTVQTIPLSIWVKPDGKMKRIDVREQTQADELYKEVGMSPQKDINE